ncbi:hypothetical protein [Paenibacillus dokdonensis]|uniref:hypothetical protein n=1 Tax=Paenibacillus dokdonensis TaxID=2567944 RepID=UPI0010A871F2|nr:hypothetical protein [Paenibacillus dokdonensis]
MKNSICGLVASIVCIILSAVFLYWNPYSTTPPNIRMINVVYTMLILPALVGIAASFLKNRILMFIVFVWSFPYGLYLSIVSIPSIWNLFGAVLIVYLVSAIQMKKTAGTQTH